MAPSPGDVVARRGRRCRARAIGGASTGARGIRRCRRFPPALLRTDARPCSSGRPRARGGSGEARGGRVRRGTHPGCERRGGPVGRSPASGADLLRLHLVRGGTRERVSEAAPHGRERLRAVRRSTGSPDLSRRAVCRPVRGPSGGVVWCSRGRSCGESPPRSRVGARRQRTCCSTQRPDQSPKALRAARRPCERPCAPSRAETSERMTVSAGGHGSPGGLPASSGTTRRGTR